MKGSTEKKIGVGIAVVLAALVINAFISYRAMRRVITNNEGVTHTHEVLTELEATLSTMIDAETGQRGFLITGENAYLEPYQTALAQIDVHLLNLKRLTADNKLQQARLP